MAATPEETLAEEARRRTKAGAAAIAAGLLLFAGSLLSLTVNNGFPLEHVIDALRASFGEGPGSGPGLVARKVLFYDDHLLAIVVSLVMPLIATGLAAVALVSLFLSTKARNPELRKLPLIVVISGAVLAVVAGVVGAISLATDVSAFAGAAHQTEPAARDALHSSFTATVYQLSSIGSFIVGIGFVLTALNAMKVGLLTRFMGVLGIIVGVLFILPPQVEGKLPFVRIFWLVGLGVLLLGRWPRAMPPAWVTGEAQPWPTQQEIREARAEAQAERSGGGLEEKLRRPRRGRPAPPETPAPEPPRSKPHSSSKKKKRKRR